MSFVSQTAACCGSRRRGSSCNTSDAGCNASRRDTSDKTPRNCCCRDHSVIAVRRNSLSRTPSLDSPTKARDCTSQIQHRRPSVSSTVAAVSPIFVCTTSLTATVIAETAQCPLIEYETESLASEEPFLLPSPQIISSSTTQSTVAV